MINTRETQELSGVEPSTSGLLALAVPLSYRPETNRH